MTKPRSVAAAFVAILLLSSCGGGGSGSKATGTTTSSAAESTTSTAPAPSTTAAPTTVDPAKATQAKAAVLQPADFPAGFAAQPDTGGGLNLEAVWKDLASCVGIDTAAPAVTATSPTFQRGIATQARSTVEYRLDPSTAPIAAALEGPKFQDCANRAFIADLDRSKPEGATPGAVTVAKRDYAQVGDKTLVWRINASVHLQDLTVPLFQDFFVIFKPGTVIRIFLLNPGSEFPQDLERTLVDKVVSRA